MDYFTLSAPTYDEAVNKARSKYGDKLRILSRRDTVKNGIFGMGKTTHCEITCFVSDEERQEDEKASEKKEEEEKMFSDFEKEARTPDPDRKNSFQTPAAEDVKEPSVKPDFSPYFAEAECVLRLNDFSESYIKWCRDELASQLSELKCAGLSFEDFELMLLDKIAGSFEIAHSVQTKPERVCVILGITGSGKTTGLAKLAAMYGSSSNSTRRNVRIVSLDDNAAVLEQLKRLGSILNIDVDAAKHESELSHVLKKRFADELVLVDTCGKPLSSNDPDYKLYGLMNVTDQSTTAFFVTVPAPMKNSDIKRIFELFAPFSLKGIIITKLDETVTVGNVISAAHENNIPLVFATDGKKIPKDLKMVTLELLLSFLKGFKINMNRFFENGRQNF